MDDYVLKKGWSNLDPEKELTRCHFRKRKRKLRAREALDPQTATRAAEPSPARKEAHVAKRMSREAIEAVQSRIVELLADESSKSLIQTAVSEEFQTSSRQFDRCWDQLRVEGRIVRHGGGRHVRWSVAKSKRGSRVGIPSDGEAPNPVDPQLVDSMVLFIVNIGGVAAAKEAFDAAAAKLEGFRG